MTTEDLKADIHQLVERIQDPQFLNAVYTILEKQAASERDFWTALTPEQQAGIEEGIKDAEAGRVRTMADVMRKY
ncbi:hypothetical protein GCM10023189_42180 [Nibrella saemangeumensis]|uniref:Addiction module component n=1 Tax=Nibrella saemangeumensis TaxID=1084526 RepID=A0ABP8ND17_9BACT